MIDGVVARLQSQAAQQAASLELPATARELVAELRAVLIRASNTRALRTSPNGIKDQLKLAEPQGDVAEKLGAACVRDGAMCIFGGARNQGRSTGLAHFARRDGAWFDFAITVRQAEHRLELLAYSFEIRFPVPAGVPFARFDLNLPNRGEERELRRHVHPGSDDLRLPAPVLGPRELLVLFVHGLKPEREPRRRTEFEREWFREAALGG